MDVSHHNGHVAEMSEKLEKSLSLDSDDKMETYHRLIQEGKDVARRGDMNKALDLFKLALELQHSDKLEKRIQKIQELLSQNESEDEDEEFVNVNGSGLMLFKELHDNLYDYQREGVAFLYGLYRDKRRGGILADDMGLGKTIQVISFLSGMYDNELVKHTLLVMPTSLITNWTKEFAKWTPGMRVKEFHGAKAERTRNLEKVQRRSGVVITTYTMLMNNWQQLASYGGAEFTWDYVILDEAHKIKTASTKTAKSAYAVPSKNRVLLTGTPVQNNLREMWALFDFACQGALLGTAKTFKTEYENPITRAREKDATPGEKALGSRMSENLMAIIKPYFLRRTKSDVQRRKQANAALPVKEEVTDGGRRTGAVVPTLTRKNDLIVWTFLSGVQEDIYRQFISLDHIKELLLTTRSPLAELTILKKLCDHPRLLSAGAIAKLGLEESHGDDGDAATDNSDIASVPDDTLISESGKLVFLFSLLEQLRQEGHRTLVFARYRKVLDIIQRILGNRGFTTLRLDGTVTHVAERERRISLFQNDRRYSVFLLTTQVGGVGITLTAADRVVIYDPSWNPATDAQAVDRAYRIGQTENVVIYRLITCGTVEEKIYRRQVFKDSLIRQNTGDKKNPFRYFSKQELKELFTLEDTRSSSTQLQLQELHARHRRTDAQLDRHIARLHAMDAVFGISDHDLMFSLDVNRDDEEAPDDYIEGRVQKAQELMKAESELQQQLTESMASSTEPAWLRHLQDGGGNVGRKNSNRGLTPRQQDSSVDGSEAELGSTSASGDDGGSGGDLGMKPKNLKASPSPRQHDSSVEVVELDGLEAEFGSTSASGDNGGGVIDLTADENDHDHDESVNDSMVASGNEAELSESKAELNESKVELSESKAELSESKVELSESKAELNESKVELSESKVKLSESEAVELDLSASGDDGDAAVDLTVNESAPRERLAAGVDSSEASHVSVAESLVTSSSLDAPSQSMERSLPEDDGDKDLFAVSSHWNSDDSAMDTSRPHRATTPKNKRLSVLQASNSSFRAETSADGGGLESFEGNFNLVLEDSDMFTDGDGEDGDKDGDGDGEDEDGEDVKLLSKLLLDGSFDVDRSLCERRQDDESMDDSFIATRKKKTAVIYDSDDDDDQQRRLDPENSFQALGASTPKSEPSGSAPRRLSRKSVGGNTSVASRRSLLHSVLEDVDDHDWLEDSDSDRGEPMEEEEEEEEAKQEEVDEEEEETTGETLNTEDEEEMSDELEESTGELELTSSERMDQCAAVANGVGSGVAVEPEEESYDSLVVRGKRCYSDGKLDEALSFFLRAIDLKPGDPEVQLMTIQLYRQLSQHAAAR